MSSVEKEVSKAAKEFLPLKASVEELSEDMALRKIVLDILEQKTKIYARSEEERKKDGRGRPAIDLEETKKET